MPFDKLMMWAYFSAESEGRFPDTWRSEIDKEASLRWEVNVERTYYLGEKIVYRPDPRLGGGEMHYDGHIAQLNNKGHVAIFYIKFKANAYE